MRDTKFQPPSAEQKWKALSDIWTFADIINFHGGSAAFSLCHKELVKWYNSIPSNAGGKRALVLMPRGHLKSTIMTVLMTLHDIFINPNIRIFIGTSTRPLALAIVREIKQYLENPILQEHVWNARPHIRGQLIPTMERSGSARRRDRLRPYDDLTPTEAEDKKIVWRADSIQVMRPFTLKEPTVTAGSVGSASTGFHYDKIRLDDVVTFENAASAPKKDRLEQWLADVESVLDPQYTDDWLLGQLPDDLCHYANVGGEMTVIGTRYAVNDWYGQIIENQNDLGFSVYERNIYVNGIDNADGYLWSEKWDERLDVAMRKRLTARHFASQYLNKILADEEVVLRLDDAKHVFNPTTRLRHDKPGQARWLHENGDEEIFRLWAACDPAVATHKRADYTALVIGGRLRDGTLVVVDGFCERLTTTSLIQRTASTLKHWGVKCLYLERTGGFGHLINAFRLVNTGYQITFPSWVPQGRGTKNERIVNALEPLIRGEQLKINRVLWHQPQIQEQFQMFGGTGVHDDFPDAVEMLSELAKTPVPVKPSNYMTKFKNRKYGGFR